MIEYQHPWFFLGFVPLAVLVFLTWGQRGVRALNWSSMAGVQKRWTPRLVLAPLPKLLQVVGLGAMIVAMARPQRVHSEQILKSEGIDIVLALDVSGSMEAPDFRLKGREVDRLHIAKKVVGDFIEGRPFDRIGLVVFGEEAFTQVPLTLDHDALHSFLDNVQIGMAGANQTAIGQALAISARQLGRLEAPSKVLILLTDGRNNAGALSPLQAAEAAKTLGVTVYTVGVGATESRRRGFFQGNTEEIDEETLTQIAEATGGQYFRGTSSQGLASIYETIDRLEKSTAEIKELMNREELFHKALLPGVLCLLLQLLLARTLLRRLP
jgi:Ca-activated chloride channel family protein